MGKIEIKTIQVGGFYPAFMGMRNPKDSWQRSDTVWEETPLKLGERDLTLAITLSKAGKEHRKYLRQIQVWANVTMPRYWWQEADTYKFGTKNSCSTMHTLHKKEFTFDDFYIPEVSSIEYLGCLENSISILNQLRNIYLQTRDYERIKEIKRLLPESYIQMRTWNTNYEELMNMYHQRKTHLLKEEWQDCFCAWCESLPYFKELCIDSLNKK